MKLRLRPPEWVLIGFFSYIALLAVFFPERPHLHYQPLLLLAAVCLLYAIVGALEVRRAARAIEIARDWLPLLLTLAAFQEMEFFLPKSFDYHWEKIWIGWDRLVLHDWQVRSAIERFGKVLPFYFEICYLLVYGLSSFCVGMVERDGHRAVDRFWVVYLTGTLGAYALFPYFPSQPPRYVFPAMEAPQVMTWARHFNLFLLSRATIHVGVFPSAHVSSAFSAAWAMFLIKPKHKILGWGLLLYAVSVSVATVYGRYHYVSDVAAGFAVSLAGAAVCLVLRAREYKSG
jgi:membrane-associated phospholipid phosphatase